MKNPSKIIKILRINMKHFPLYPNKWKKIRKNMKINKDFLINNNN